MKSGKSSKIGIKNLLQLSRITNILVLIGHTGMNNSLTLSALTGKLVKTRQFIRELFIVMADDKPQTDEWLSANKAGKEIGVTGKTIIRMAENNEITGYRVSSVWRFKRSDIEVYLEAHRYGPRREQSN
jgi:excisionase family DNA binding protein